MDLGQSTHTTAQGEDWQAEDFTQLYLIISMQDDLFLMP